jgi:hypothetical protein
MALDALLLTIFGAAALGLAQRPYRYKWKGAVVVGVVAIGILAAGLPHSLRFIDYIGVDEFKRSDPMIEHVKRDTGIFRVLPLTGSSFYNRNYLPLFGLETANGFYDNRIRYYDLLAGENFTNLLAPNIMRMTNIKYVITTQKIDHPLLALSRDLGNAFVYENRGFLERAFLVHEAVVAPTDSLAMVMMKQPGFDAARTIVLHGGDPLDAQGEAGEDVVDIRDLGSGAVRIEVATSSPGYLYYSGNYLPYWKAFVDGREEPVVRCNVAMRAVYLEPGNHTVEMRYASPWLRIGAIVCLVSVVLAGLIIYLGLRPHEGRRR